MSELIHVWQNGAKARLHHLLRSFLNQKSRSTLKKWQGTARRRLSGVYLLRYGSFTATELVADLAARIPTGAEILMVHSSFDRLLPMYQGTPRQLIDELIAFCGNRRTLVMPAFVLGGRLYDKRQYFQKHAFDVNRTPSEMGLLSELFRRTSGVLRSLHPTHSVCAFGPLAEQITANQELATTRTGAGTPFDIMTKRLTAIAGVGIEYYRCITHTHTAEDLLGDDFPVKFTLEQIPVTMIDRLGNKIPFSVTIPQSKKPLDNTLLRSLLSHSELVEWTFRGAPMFITTASLVTERLIEAARKGITVYD